MDNNNMDELIKKAQEMIQNNQVPDEIKQIVNNLNNGSTSNTTYANINTNASSNANTDNKNHNNNDFNNFSNNSKINNNNVNINSNSKIDMNQLMKIMSTINSNSSDDDLTRLLFALKPYLRNERKSKIDDYIKLIRMGKLAQLFDSLGGEKNE